MRLPITTSILVLLISLLLLDSYVSIYVRRARVYSPRLGFSIIIYHIHLFNSQQLAIDIIDYRLDALRGYRFGPKFLLSIHNNSNYHILGFYMILFHNFYIWYSFYLSELRLSTRLTRRQSRYNKTIVLFVFISFVLAF